MADRVAMYSPTRILERPAWICRLPWVLPLSRLSGATPTDQLGDRLPVQQALIRQQRRAVL